jgi:cytochrome c oxidase subunit II
VNFHILPPAASQVAVQVDRLGWTLLTISAVVLTAVFAPMAVFLFRYRRGRPAERSPAHLPTIKIEVTWTLVSFFVFLGLFAWGANIYWVIQTPPKDATEINVVGKQWMWKLQHPEGNREINELHVPVRRNVKLTLASQDVIHSFYLPEFRIKQDVVPGWYRTIWFNAKKTGEYHLFCSEFCGTHHSAMIGRVVVMEPADYQNWLVHGQPGITLAQSGEKLFRELGCSGCHENSTIVRAPPLQGLFGKPVPLLTGQIVTADEGYIRDSILLPAKDIAAGYTNDMPSYEGRVSEEQILELIAYIRSIGDKPAQTPVTFQRK